MAGRARRIHIPRGSQEPSRPAESPAEGVPDHDWPEAVADWLDEDGAEHLQYVLGKDAKDRLDKHLQNRIRGLSRHQVQKLIALGGVRVNGKTPKRSLKLKKGDVIDVILPPRPSSEIKPEALPLDILYEDEAFIVLNKQAGLIVHPARGQLTGTMLNALAFHFQQQAKNERRQAPADDRASAPSTADYDEDPGLRHPELSTVGASDARPGIVHRLDKNTTGVIVVAKQDEPHWLLARQFEDRSNLKAYLALVHGCPDPPGGAIEHPIGKHPTIREAMAIRHDAAAKHALTLYRVRERYRGYSLVELELKTGRTHQIRVHLAYVGHPIVGDILYGGEPVGRREVEHPPLPAAARPHINFARPKAEGDRLEAEALTRDDMLMHTPALHAALLRLQHPILQKDMTFTAPVPSPMRDLVDALRQHPAAGPVVTEGYHIDLQQALPAGEPPPQDA